MKLKTNFEEIFESGWFTKGKYVEQFREGIKSYTGVKHAYLTTSATTALTMSLKLFEIKEGDEVIISDFSYPATANAVEDIGATPIFSDVSLETYNMLPEEMESKITKKNKSCDLCRCSWQPNGDT